MSLRKVAVCSAAAAALASALAGCADNESSLFVVGVLDLTDSDCVLEPNPEGPFLGMGVLDTSLRSTYTAALLVGNQLTERGSRNQLRTETSRIRLEGADVILEDSGGGDVAEFSTLGSGFVHPASGTDPSYGGFFADVVPPGVALGDGVYVARIKVYGTTLGGQELDSAELRFPIQACYGCLISYPGAAMDVNVPAGSAYLCATSSNSVVGDPEDALGTNGCFLGQDRPVSCVLCAATVDICRDPALNTSP